MGQINTPQPVLLILAAFSRHDQAFDWVLEQVPAAWGDVVLTSPKFDFAETDYYEPTMGPGLLKQFWAFETLIDPARLPEIKRQTNDWEAAYSQLGQHDERRPLNLDPGYLTLAKLVLASTKDHAHRIYLAQGIYAEVTLRYQHRGWKAWDWTFPDYRRSDYHEFFDQCRGYVQQQLRRGTNA